MKRQRSDVNRRAELEEAIGGGSAGSPGQARPMCAQSSNRPIVHLPKGPPNRKGHSVAPRRTLNTAALRFTYHPFLQLSTVTSGKQPVTSSGTASYGKHAAGEEGVENLQKDGRAEAFCRG
jgi:hypothetical protein